MKKGNWKAKLSALVVAFSLVFTAACATGGGGGTGGEEVKQEIKVGFIVSEPPSLDPAKATDNQSGFILRHVMEGLTRMGEDGNPQPGIAEKWEVSPDGLKITFHLRDAKWSNGDPVTAHDFEYAWKRVLDPKLKPPADYAYQLYYLKNGEKYNKGKAKAEDVGVKAIDDKTLEVILEKPTPYFVSLTSFYTLLPVNKKVAEANDKWHADAKTYVGNGPFNLTVWEHDKKIVLEKNPDYWNADKVKLNKIELPFIGDPKTAVQQFQSGALDYTRELVPADLTPSLIKKGEAKAVKIPGTYMYVFNVKEKPFTNKKIRKAFSLAIDRKSIVENVSQAQEKPATGWVPWLIPDFVQNKEWPETHEPYLPETAQVEEAKRLLQEGMKEEGWDKLPPITLDYNEDEGHKKIAEAVQQMWKKNLGVDVKLNQTEWKVYLDKVTTAHDFQVARMGWLPDYIDPMTYMDMWVTGGGNNYAQWSNKEYDRLIQEAKSTADQKKRMEAMHKAEEILMDEMPIAPIYYYTETIQIKDYLKGVKHLPDAEISFIEAYVEK